MDLGLASICNYGSFSSIFGIGLNSYFIFFLHLVDISRKKLKAFHWWLLNDVL